MMATTDGVRRAFDAAGVSRKYTLTQNGATVQVTHATGGSYPYCPPRYARVLVAAGFAVEDKGSHLVVR